ncbi:MAG: glycosyltransferase family 4 protein [Prolixibacteraceae bacterium]|nr:glycosyltransferase family 4 protein [Prolixibacteraceae bacterium]MBN2650705.1 glycosyltransferase family 4 protein [Prolixibacteraceae bacterium]
MKKVLIITYYWPPSGGGGVQRWLKFTKYLPQYGWNPIVVVPENAEYPSKDESLLKDIPNDVQIIKVPIWEPYQLFKLLTGKKKEEKVNAGFLFDGKKKSFFEKMSLWLRGNLLIPDPRVFWVKTVFKSLSPKIYEMQPDCIVTTGPPHSLHLAGLKLHKKTGVKWVADFRDPWSTIDYLDYFYLSEYARKKQRRLERKVLENANLVLSVSENWKKELHELGAKNVEVVTNGYDHEDFETFRKRPTGKFVMTYAGLITSLRNPVSLWNTLENLCEENAEFAEKFELRLIGSIDQQVMLDLKNRPFLGKRIVYLGYISHDKVIKQYEEASVLLLLLNQSDNAKGHIPGKFFEYMAAQTPILALGAKGGDVDEIMAAMRCGLFADFYDIGIITKWLSEQLQKPNMKQDEYSVDEFSRRMLTEKLSKIINSLT